MKKIDLIFFTHSCWSGILLQASSRIFHKWFFFLSGATFLVNRITVLTSVWEVCFSPATADFDLNKENKGGGAVFLEAVECVFLFLWKVQISNSFFQLHKLKCLKTFHLCVHLPACVFLTHTDRELIVWWTPSWLCLQHCTQTPSTGLPHPSSNHCHSWLHRRSGKTVSQPTGWDDAPMAVTL